MAKETSLAIWVFLVPTICVLLVVVVLFLTPANKHRTQVDYFAEYNRISKPANFDPNDNAVPYFEKAFEVITEGPNDLVSFRKLWPADMNDDQLQIAKQWVASNTQALDYLKQGISKSYYWEPLQADNNELIKADVKDISKFRKATYLLCLNAKLMAQQRQIEPAMRQLADVYKMGTLLAGPKFMTYQLVGTAISTLSVQAAFQIFDHTNLPASILKEFQQRITSLSPNKTFMLDFTTERLIFYDEVQRDFACYRGTKLSESPGLYFKLLFLKTVGRSWGMREKHQADMMYDYFDNARLKTPWQLHNEGVDLYNIANNIANKALLLSRLTPSLSRVFLISVRGRVYSDALIATTAILRYKADVGKYPKNLQELVTAGYLANLPMDPFSGGPLTYKLSGDNFELYSFAEDLDDDGGKHNPDWAREGDGDYVFWPVQKIETTERTKTQN